MSSPGTGGFFAPGAGGGVGRRAMPPALVVLFAALVAATLAAGPARSAATLAVDRTDDPDPATAGACTADANDCSLRGAVVKANVTPGADLISLPAGDYALSIAGEFEDASATGDLDVTESVTIEGAGASTTVVSAGGEEGNGAPDLGDRVLQVADGSTATIKGLTLSGGSFVDSSGGGIYNFGTLNLSASAVRDNAADFGGGGITNEGTLRLSGSTVSGNTANVLGGGIYTFGFTASLVNSTVSGNQAGESGGGISNTAPLNLTRTTVSGNTAGQYGGGVYSDTDTPDPQTAIENSTVSGNSAGDQGGGLYNWDGVTTVRSTTITGNTAPQGQGAGVAGFGDAQTRTAVSSSIIAGNLGPDPAPATGTDVDFVDSAANSFVSEGHNVIGDGNATAAFDQAGDQKNVANPKLGPLADNGGATRTHLLLPGSPAIDAGDTALTIDQRGAPRPQNGDGVGADQDDAGSVEKRTVDATAPTVVAVTPAAGSTGVPLSANVFARFSEPMRPGTINTSTFRLVRLTTRTDGTLVRTPVSAAVTYDAAASRATLNPNANLTPGTRYEATVSTGARDAAGNPLAAPRVWIFTTRT